MAGQRSADDAVSEPPVEHSGGTKHIAWTVRTPAGDPQRYTRFVAIMKRTLLLAALALIAAVIAYSLQPREQSRVAMTFEHIGKVANDLAMIKPRLSGTDATGNPFVVTADRAVQDGRNTRRARLYNVQADITLKKNGWLSASASEGVLDADAKMLSLIGSIAVYSDNGYELHTSRIDADLGKGVMHGDNAVTGQGPLGTLHADRFVIDRQSKQVHLIGHVKMTIYKHGVHKRGAGRS